MLLPVATPRTAESLHFGSQTIATVSAPRSVTFTNDNQNLLLRTAVRIVGEHPSDFVVSYNGCTDAAFGLGQRCEVQVRFVPSALGDRYATLQVLSNAHAQSPLSVGLEGNAVATAEEALMASAVRRGREDPRGPQGHEATRACRGLPARQERSVSSNAAPW